MTGIRTQPTTRPQKAEPHEFLHELALALARQAMYPGGHPTVDAAVQTLLTRLTGLLAEQPALSLGVARRQIVYEGEASPANHPVLRALADRLHRHRIGALLFQRGVAAEEVTRLLRALAADPDRPGGALGDDLAACQAEWPHLRLHRVTYEQLELSADAREGDVEGEEGGGGDGEATARATQLWLGLANAALAAGATGEVAAGSGAGAAQDSVAVARAINAHPGAAAYDQQVVGYLSELARELRGGGSSVAGVQRRLSRLVRNLDPTTLRRLLDMGGDHAQRRRFLMEASDTLTADTVLELVRAAAQSETETISTSMVRMLSKLSAFAESDIVAVQEQGDAALRAQVRELIHDWSLDDPNPDAYTQALEGMARHGAESTTVTAAHAPEPLRVVQMGLEVGVVGKTYWEAVDALLAQGELEALIGLLDAAPAASEARARTWEQLETTDHIRHLLTTDPVDFPSLDRILERLPVTTVASLLLDRISESASRATRMGVFKRLSARGLPVVALVMERLGDDRWFVLRNMLALLDEIGGWPKGFSPLAYARHGHATVRREALQLAVRVPAEREEALRLALGDSDERALRVGVQAAASDGLPLALLPLALERLKDETLSPELRAQLVHVLPHRPDPALLERLVHIAAPGRTLLGKPRLAPKTLPMLAALTALAATGAADARSRAVLALAAAADDQEIRNAARRPA